MPIARHLPVALEAEAKPDCGTMLRTLPRPRVTARIAAVIAATCCFFMLPVDAGAEAGANAALAGADILAVFGTGFKAGAFEFGLAFDPASVLFR